MGYSFKFRKFREDMILKDKLKAMLHDNGISLTKSLLWDERYYGFSLVDWNKVFFNVLKNMPRYTTDKMDCDNFTLFMVVRITEKYKSNGCGIAIGDSPMGYHAWNIFLATGFELFYIEPQTSMVYSVEEDSGYKAHYVVWG